MAVLYNLSPLRSAIEPLQTHRPYFAAALHNLSVAFPGIVSAVSRGRVRQGGVISAVAVGHRQAALAVMCRG